MRNEEVDPFMMENKKTKFDRDDKLFDFFYMSFEICELPAN